MREIHIAHRLVGERHKRGVSQEELAAYIGVSKAAVSKWENEQSYPDITLLPRLAAYFDLSIDELMGYEPQLTKEEIRRKYFYLAERFAGERFETVMEECRKLVKQYYSCYPFLLQMAILLLNHAQNGENPQETLEYALTLLERVKQESRDVGECREAALLAANVYLLLQRPGEALDCLDERILPMRQETELLAKVYESLGKKEKALEVLQIAMYQHLLSMVSGAASYLMLCGEEYGRAAEVICRTDALIKLFQVENLHPNATVGFYLSAAQVFCMNQRMAEALEMLQKYTRVCLDVFLPFQLHGDAYFDRLDGWFEEFDLGKQAPRSDVLIRQSMVQAIRDNPCFQELRDDPAYQKLIRELETFCNESIK